MYNNVLIINVLIITRGKRIGGYGFSRRPKLQQEITLHRVYVLCKGTAFYASFIFRNKYIYIYIRVSNMGTEITTYGYRSARCDSIVPGRIFVFDPKFHCTEYGKDDIE